MGSAPSASPGPERMRKRNLDTMEKWFRRDLDSHFSKIPPRKARDRARWILSIAQQSKDPTVLFYCGVLYERGYGVKKNASVALRHYKHAARRQIVRGMEKVAVFYHNGIGVERDTRRAIRWYSRAAKLGSLRSMKTLVFLYGNGIGGVARDEAMAAKWKARIKRATGEEYEDHTMRLKVAMAALPPPLNLEGAVAVAAQGISGATAGGGHHFGSEDELGLDAPLPPPPATSSSSSPSSRLLRRRPLSHRPYLQRPLAGSSLSSPPRHRVAAAGHHHHLGTSQSPLQPKRQRHHRRGDPRDIRDPRQPLRHGGHERGRGHVHSHNSPMGSSPQPHRGLTASSPPLPQLIPKLNLHSPQPQPQQQHAHHNPSHNPATTEPAVASSSSGLTPGESGPEDVIAVAVPSSLRSTRSPHPPHPRLADHLGLGARHSFSSSILERSGGFRGGGGGGGGGGSLRGERRDSRSRSGDGGEDDGDDDSLRRMRPFLRVRPQLKHLKDRKVTSFTAGHTDVRKRAQAAYAARLAAEKAFINGGISPSSTISSDVSTLADVAVSPDRDKGMVQGQKGYVEGQFGHIVSSDSEEGLSVGSSQSGSSSEDLANLAFSPNTPLPPPPDDDDSPSRTRLPRLGRRRLSKSPGPPASPHGSSGGDSDWLKKSGSWSAGSAARSRGAVAALGETVGVSPSTGQKLVFPRLGQASKLLFRNHNMKERHASLPPAQFDRILLQKKIQEADAAKNAQQQQQASEGGGTGPMSGSRRSRSAGRTTDMSLLDSNMQSLRRRSSPRDKHGLGRGGGGGPSILSGPHDAAADFAREEETGKAILTARLEAKERQLREERAQHVRTQDTLRRCQKESQNMKARVRALQKELAQKTQELKVANKMIQQLREQHRKRE